MHEISIAGAMIDIILESANKNNINKIQEVCIEVGELTSLNPEQLKFIFKVISKNTILEGAKINIKVIPTFIECNNCDYKGSIDFYEKLHYIIPDIKCPKCHDLKVNISKGRECNVKSIKV
ncbi:MAG: hydrogenase maturation nickel metallochaperone HypA [Methanosarcinales archaeon]|nr:hydrogenase maturation nickel metallochaperone HypA [Methanosarcinales archaeon]